MNLSPSHIATLCQGQLVQSAGQSKIITTFCTDSRKVHKAQESIFVALTTPARDGHSFINAAYQQGIRTFLYSKSELDVTQYAAANFILVSDTLRAMQQISTYMRKLQSYPVLGITGSNGKTIVKEWLGQLFAQTEHRVVRNPKSYNSQLGVPVAVSAMNETHTLGIFEAGISQPGEMSFLENIIQPTHGIFTMIGEAHEANFDSTAQKIREKLVLFKQAQKLYFSSNHKQLGVEIQKFVAQENTDLTLVSWGYDVGNQLQIKSIETSDGQTKINAVWKETDIKLVIPYQDAAYIENAIHCWLVILDFGYEPKEIAPWFGQLNPVSMRLELIKGINNCTLINDAYSADLASLHIGLNFLKEQNQHSKHSVLLSDILQHTPGLAIYDEVLAALQEQKLHRVILIGPETQNVFERFSKKLNCIVEHYLDTQLFLDTLNTANFTNESILIKGARRFLLERVVNRLSENIHGTVLNINLSALLNNINVYRKRLDSKTKIMAMVKAFSYGSSTFEVASTLEHHGVDYLAVAYVDEAILLRKKGITLPILILNPDLNSLAAMVRYNLEPEVYSINLLHQFAQGLKQLHKTLNIHIKLDTGMHRLGIEPAELAAFLEAYKQYNCFRVKSVFSHLVGSDTDEHNDFTEKQRQLFADMAQQIEQTIGYDVIKHISNSGGALKNKNLQFDMVRLGIGLYGLDPRAEIQQELQEVSTLKTNIAQIKQLDRQETIGYGRAGKLARDSKIATLNIGYADGYSRVFSRGTGKVLINGKLAPVVGNVCMDMIMVDVTDVPNVSEGQEVIIFGKDLPVTQLANWANTISYEILAGISQRVKRVFYYE